jgi:hypothetical protein
MSVDPGDVDVSRMAKMKRRIIDPSQWKSPINRMEGNGKCILGKISLDAGFAYGIDIAGGIGKCDGAAGVSDGISPDAG